MPIRHDVRFPLAIGAIGAAALSFRVIYVLALAPDVLPSATPSSITCRPTCWRKGMGSSIPSRAPSSDRRRATAGHPPLFSTVLSRVSFARRPQRAGPSAGRVLHRGRCRRGDRVPRAEGGRRTCRVPPHCWLRSTRCCGSTRASLVVESLYALLLTLVLLFAYRFWHQPNPDHGRRVRVAVGSPRSAGERACCTCRCSSFRSSSYAVERSAARALLSSPSPSWPVLDAHSMDRPEHRDLQEADLASSTANVVLAGRTVGVRTTGAERRLDHRLRPRPAHGDESEQWSTAGRRGVRYATSPSRSAPDRDDGRLAGPGRFTWRPTRFTSHGVSGSGSSGS